MLRSLSSFSFEDFKDFASNDYLGLSGWTYESDEDFKSSTGSRLITGNSKQLDHTENFLAEFFEADSALIFNSGYDANLGLFSSLPQKEDTVIYDELIHASIRDGIRLSNARNFKFAHNDLIDLKSKLKNATGEIFIAVESVYSMDGDFAPLKEILKIAKEYNAKVIVDEAHSGGVFGTGGRGICQEKQIQDQVFARVITFGKAFGSHGAIVLGNRKLKEFLVNFARSFIYTTGLPNHAIERIEKVVIESKYIENKRKILFANIEYFKSLFSSWEEYQIESDSPIQTLIFPGNEKVKSLEKELLSYKFLCKAILSPTVPKGKERLRISIHSFNTKEEIYELMHLIQDWKRKR